MKCGKILIGDSMTEKKNIFGSRRRTRTARNLKNSMIESDTLKFLDKTNVKKKKMRIVNIIIIFLVLLLVVFGLMKIFNGRSKGEIDNLIYNKNKSFIRRQKVDGFAFKDIKCSYDGKNSLISYTLTNETNDKIYLNNYDIIVKDKNKRPIIIIVASYDGEVESKQSVKLVSSVVGIDLTDAYYMELKLKVNNG